MTFEKPKWEFLGERVSGEVPPAGLLRMRGVIAPMLQKLPKMAVDSASS